MRPEKRAGELLTDTKNYKDIGFVKRVPIHNSSNFCRDDFLSSIKVAVFVDYSHSKPN